MPKRSAEEKILYYQKKIKKIEASNRIRKRVFLSDSSDSEENSNCEDKDQNNISASEAVPSTRDVSAVPGTDPGVQPAPTAIDCTPLDVTLQSIEDSGPVLEPEILQALGANTDDEPEYGMKIHDNLSQLWLPLLKKGMSKEEKDKTSKTYLVPENCKLLQAPKLNLEISAAISESARGRDKKLAVAQQQLGVGVTAVNRGLDVLLTNKEENAVIKAIKHLSDACRILCDLHYMESQARVKLITPNLDKGFLNIIKDTRRDETLFGLKLSEKIKSSKTIEKQGLQIKKASATSNAVASTSAPRPSQQQQRGNWNAPPRYTTKSGRGAGKKGTAARRPAQAAPPPPPPVKQARPHTRAQAQQQ